MMKVHYFAEIGPEHNNAVAKKRANPGR